MKNQSLNLNKMKNQSLNSNEIGKIIEIKPILKLYKD